MTIEHTFNFDMGHDQDALAVRTIIEDEGTEDQFVRQELILGGECRSTIMNLSYDLTPVQLRELADQLEVFVPTIVIEPASELEIDIDLTDPQLYEFRLVHKTTGMFICAGVNPHVPMFDADWRNAAYFGGGKSEGTLKFQWEWMRDECEEEWMHKADMNDYRVHVVCGVSDC